MDPNHLLGSLPVCTPLQLQQVREAADETAGMRSTPHLEHAHVLCQPAATFQGGVASPQVDTCTPLLPHNNHYQPRMQYRQHYAATASW